MYIRVTLIFFLGFLTADSYAQFWKKKEKRAGTENGVQQPTSLNPLHQEQRAYVPKASRKASKGPTYGLEQEFYDRMEELAKVRKKNERLMEKPQYSNPLYFGHKRPPKKRKPSKMKFCKECGIRH
jgi:hypothetical protein